MRRAPPPNVKYDIHHHTVYRYSSPLQRSVHELRLTPRSGPLQAVHNWEVQVPGRLSKARDGFGNVVHNFTVSDADEIRITATGQVEVDGASGIFTDAQDSSEATISPLYYLTPTPLTAPADDMRRFAAPYLAAGHGVPALLALAEGVAARVRYKAKSTDVGTSAAEAFRRGAGVCQDQAQVLVSMCRAFGIPARYVSGYFYDPAATALASHAWADICLDVDRETWCSVDVTHHCVTDARHVRLAVGRDYQGAAPVRGVREGGEGETLEVALSITPAA